MKRYVCIHGHFYQPPRENPWLEELEWQESAQPYHDWNERITMECYAPNAYAHILDHNQKIIDIVNNYEKISFNFGPTLLSWMERNDPEIYARIIESDKASRKNFSGHGSAMAQCYNHMVMPLANSRDKETQVLWGCKDFQYRFGRKPEGMWLPETAVDLETLDIMAKNDIRFTLLAPHQAGRFRRIGRGEWIDVRASGLDPRVSYLCRLPSGRDIAIFFYDTFIAHDVAFGDLLFNGKNFADRFLHIDAGFHEDHLIHIATDGETYGHHHRRGDMALAYCLHSIEQSGSATLTNYAEFLAHHSPQYEVEIIENSSWSCIHGVERWRGDCGCRLGTMPSWTLAWRAPLREAMDWLRDELGLLYEEIGGRYLKDVWSARNDYIRIVLDRREDTVNEFLSLHASKFLDKEERVSVLNLLEMQRSAMLMYTSCGWFFDEISGIESTQILTYAARAIQLAEGLSQKKYEAVFTGILKKAPSNFRQYYGDGRDLYLKRVKPMILELVHVGAHYALSSFFEDYPTSARVHCYNIENLFCECNLLGKGKVCAGKVRVSSALTGEEQMITYAVLYHGGLELEVGVSLLTDENQFLDLVQEIRKVSRTQDLEKVRQIMIDRSQFGPFALANLFKDSQRNVLYQILDTKLEQISASLKQINEFHYPLVKVMRQLHVPLPKMLSSVVQAMVNADIIQILTSPTIDYDALEKLVNEVKDCDLEIDRQAMEYFVKKKIDQIMERLLRRTEDVCPLKEFETMMKAINPLSLDIDYWKAQNQLFSLGKKFYPPMKKRAGRGEETAVEWIKYFELITDYFKLNIEGASEFAIARG